MCCKNFELNYSFYYIGLLDTSFLKKKIDRSFCCAFRLYVPFVLCLLSIIAA